MRVSFCSAAPATVRTFCLFALKNREGRGQVRDEIPRAKRCKPGDLPFMPRIGVPFVIAEFSRGCEKEAHAPRWAPFLRCLFSLEIPRKKDDFFIIIKEKE